LHTLTDNLFYSKESSDFIKIPLDIAEHVFYTISKLGAINSKPGVSPEHGSAVWPFDKTSTRMRQFLIRKPHRRNLMESREKRLAK
jgi:hypothetical protein